MYCGDNPVMNVDPSGSFGFIFTLLISAIAGAIFSGAVSVAQQVITNSYNNVNWWQVGADMLLGAASGLAFGAGGAIGGIIKGAIKVGLSISKTAAISLTLGLSVTTNVAAGMGSYALEYAGGQHESFNPLVMIMNGLGQGFSSLVDTFVGASFVAGNVWKVGKGVKNSFSSKIARTVGRSIITALPKYFIEELFMM